MIQAFRCDDIRTVELKQYGKQFPGDIFKSIFLKKKCISIRISLKWILMCPTDK